MAQYKEMLHVLKFVLELKTYGLKFLLLNDKIWKLEGISDANFASDKETHISVTGYVIYFMGIPIAGQSHGQKGVVISTTEVEYVAFSAVVTILKFIIMVLQSMEIEVELPITVYVDNIGAIFLAVSHTTSDRMKHMDIYYHLICEYGEDGIVKIEFVKSEESDADLFTKNLLCNLFEKHAQKLVWKHEEVDVEAQQEG